VNNHEELIEEAESWVAHVKPSVVGAILRDMISALESVRAERDAAAAAIERVRAIHRSTMPGYGPKACVHDGRTWPCPTVAALDGAPEPEWEYCFAEVETKREMTSPVYVLRGGVYLLDEHAGVLIDSAGNFSAKTKGNPRSLAVLLKAIAEAVEDDVELVPVKGESVGA
jgi:hypothetical protein